MKFFSYIVLFLALVVAAAAADITGKWSGSITVLGDGQSGDPSPAYMVAKQDGTTLTGTGGPNENEQWPIQNGKVVGNKITAEVTSQEGAVYTLNMTLDGDHMAGEVTMTREGQTMKAKIDMKRLK